MKNSLVILMIKVTCTCFLLITRNNICNCKGKATPRNPVELRFFVEETLAKRGFADGESAEDLNVQVGQ